MILDYYTSSTGAQNAIGAASFLAATNSGSPCSLSAVFSGLHSGITLGTGIRINIKSDGPYARGGTDTLYLTGSSQSPIIFRGYKNTPGDGYQGRINGNGPLITGNMPVLNYPASTYINWSNGFGFVVFDSIMFRNPSGAGILAYLCPSVSNSLIKSCYFYTGPTSNGFTVLQLGAHSIALDCDVYTTGTAGTTAGIVLNGSQSVADSCHIFNSSTSTGAAGIVFQSSFGIAYGNTIVNCGGRGIIMGYSQLDEGYCRNNTIVAPSGDGIFISQPNNSALRVFIGNCVTDSLTGYGINLGIANGQTGNFGIFSAYNRFRNNSGASNLTIQPSDWSTGVNYAMVSGSGPSVLDYAYAQYLFTSGDARLIQSSPAVNAGWPYPAPIGAITPLPQGQTFYSSAT